MRPEWAHVLALYSDARVDTPDTCSQVRVAGKKLQLVPAHSMRVIQGSTQPAVLNQECYALVECKEVQSLQRGLAVGRACVKVDDAGNIPVQIANFSDRDIFLKPRTTIGCIKNVAVEPRVGLCFDSEHEVCVTEIIHSAGTDEVITIFLSRMDISDVDDEQHECIRKLITKHCDIFSRDEDDLGYCDQIEHRIRTTSDVPIKVPHRKIPPQHWSEVWEYLKKSLDRDIIKPSSSPYAAPCLFSCGRKAELCDCVLTIAPLMRGHTKMRTLYPE